MRTYKAKTLKGAEERVRMLEKRIREYEDICTRLIGERIALAKLAATGPAFLDPMHAWKAEWIRNTILEKECGLKPDGSPVRPTT